MSPAGCSLHVQIGRAASLRTRTVVLEPGAAIHAHALVGYAVCAAGGASARETRARASDELGHMRWDEELVFELSAPAAWRVVDAATAAQPSLLPLRLDVYAAPGAQRGAAVVASGDARAAKPWDDGHAALISRMARRYELVGTSVLALDLRALGEPRWLGLLAPRPGAAAGAPASLPDQGGGDVMRGELLVRAWLVPGHAARPTRGLRAAPPEVPARRVRPPSPQSPKRRGRADDARAPAAASPQSPTEAAGRTAADPDRSEPQSWRREASALPRGGDSGYGGAGLEAAGFDAYGFKKSSGLHGSPRRSTGTPARPQATGPAGSAAAAAEPAACAPACAQPSANAQQLALRWERQSVAWFDALASAAVLSSAGAAELERSARLERLVALGVPVELRPRAWGELSGAQQLRHAAEAALEAAAARAPARAAPRAAAAPGLRATGAYAALLAQLADLGSHDALARSSIAQIEIDLPRTFPEHRLFRLPAAHAPLRRVLCAFALRDPARGYTQSLNFIAAFCLLFAAEEDAFWLLCAIAERLLPTHFAHGMLGVQVDNSVFETLARAQPRLARVLARLDALDAELALVSTPWFMTLFTTALPTEAALRLWDLILYHGADAMLAAGLAVLHLRTDALERSAQLECVYEGLKELGEAVADVDAFVTLTLAQLRLIHAADGAPLRALRAARARTLERGAARQALSRVAYELAREHRTPVAAAMGAAAALPAASAAALVALGARHPPAPAGAARELARVFVSLARRVLSPHWRDGRLARALCAELARSVAAEPSRSGAAEEPDRSRVLDELRAALGVDAAARTALVYRAYARAPFSRPATPEPARGAAASLDEGGLHAEGRGLCEEALATLIADAAVLVLAGALSNGAAVGGATAAEPRSRSRADDDDGDDDDGDDESEGEGTSGGDVEREAIGRPYARLALSTSPSATSRLRAGGGGSEATLSLGGFADFARKQPHLLELLYPTRSSS